MSEIFNSRFYEERDEEKIVELLEKCYNGWPKFDLNCSKKDNWIWKHIRNPLGKSCVVVTEKDGDIIGCNHGMTLKLKIFDEIYYGSQGCDDAVNPSYRGKGLSLNLQNIRLNYHKQNGFVMNYGAIRDPILIKSYRNRYNSLPFKIPLFLNILRIDDFLDIENIDFKLFKKYGYKLLSQFNKTKKILNINKVNKKIVLDNVNYFDEEFTIFWDSIKTKFFFIAERSRDYLNWRYNNNIRSYLIKTAKIDGILVGYMILSINRYDKRQQIGYIMDILINSDYFYAGHELLENSIDYFKTNNVNVIFSYLNEGTKYEKLLELYGFLKLSNTNAQLFYQKFKNDLDINKLSTVKPDQIHFSLGDTDWM